MGTEKNKRVSSGDMYELATGEEITDPRGGSSIQGPGYVRVYFNDYGVIVQQLVGSTKIAIDGVSNIEEIITTPTHET